MTVGHTYANGPAKYISLVIEPNTEIAFVTQLGLQSGPLATYRKTATRIQPTEIWAPEDTRIDSLKSASLHQITQVLHWSTGGFPL